MIVERIGRFLSEIGETDCEDLGGGLLAQPVNAISSLAYVAVGIFVAVRVAQSGRERTSSIIYAICLAAIGLGSVAFHGPQASGSQIMHDLPILVTALFVLNHDVGVIWRHRQHELWTFAGAAAVATAISVVSPGLGPPLTGVTIAGVAIAEFVIYRRRLRPITIERQRRAAIAIIVVGVIAGASWLLGRSGSPACDPDSVVQLHGLWHVISAVIFGLWWWLALAAEPQRGAE